MNITQQIGQKSADVGAIADHVIENPEHVAELIEGLKAPKGTIRYGYEKVLRLVSERRPELVYPWFEVFAGLLDSGNSFLKWGAIMTVANLAAVDSENRFEAIFEKYYGPISGTTMVTAANIIGSSAKIALAKPGLVERITRELLKVEKAEYQSRGRPSPECRNVAVGQAIDSLDQFFDRIEDKTPVVRFVRRQLENPRKPVAKKAERFLRKHRIDETTPMW